MPWRPRRPSPHPDWRPLAPVGDRSWLDLADPDAPDGVRILYALLDAGLLEAWQDRSGHIRLRAPPSARASEGKTIQPPR